MQAPACTGCIQGYVYNSGTSVCDLIPCTDPNCQSCLTSPSVCQVCNTGFTKLSNATCKYICGDGTLVAGEQCDDGNNVDGDGCNSDCTIGNNNGCSKTIPYKNPINNSCTANCPSRYYKDTATYLCPSCDYSCLTCNDLTGCTSCSSTIDFRVLSGTTCIPMPGYFQSNTAIATKCPIQCKTCDSLTNCFSCNTPSYYLSTASCLACDTITPLCSKCDIVSTVPTCTGCTSGYFFNTTTQLCQVQPCTDILCINCPNSISICTQCQTGFYPNSAGQCVSICGDNYKTVNEACDDGNSIQRDGCSKQCIIQSEFTCEVLASSVYSTCYFVGVIQIKKVYIDKIDKQNKIQIKLSLSPNDLYVWDIINMMDMIDFIIDIQSQATYSIYRNADKTVSIQLSYNEDIQNKNIVVTVNPALTKLAALARSGSFSNKFAIVPDDNSGAYYYDQSIYTIASVIDILALIIATVGFVIFLASLIVGKLVGVEMMGVLQLCYISLMTLSSTNPCFTALRSLWISNGFNMGMYKNYIQDTSAPKQTIGIYLISKFILNYNTGLILILLPLLIALIAHILLKTALKHKTQVLTKVRNRCIGQYTFTGLIFNAYLLAVSCALQLIYGIKSGMDGIGIVSIIQCCVLVPIYILYFVLLIKMPQLFGDYVHQFKVDKISAKFYNIVMIQRLIIGMGLVLLVKLQLQIILPIVICLVLAVFVAVRKCYKNKYNNVRFIVNMGICIVVLAIFMAAALSTQEDQNKKTIYYYLPLIVCILLIICVSYSLIFIIYQFYKAYRNYKIQQIEDKDMIQLAKVRKQNDNQNIGVRPRRLTTMSRPDQAVSNNVDILSNRNNNNLDNNKRILNQQQKLENIKKQIKDNFSLSPNNINNNADFSQRQHLLDITIIPEHPQLVEVYKEI